MNKDHYAGHVIHKCLPLKVKSAALAKTLISLLFVHKKAICFKFTFYIHKIVLSKSIK